MHPAYFETRFKAKASPAWPAEFGVVSAYPTTGTTWPPHRSLAADEALARDLAARNAWMARVTGYSPTTGHAEPSWAVALAFDELCDLGKAYLQDAIYWIRGDDLFVAHCDARRAALMRVGSFRARLDP